MPWQEQIPLIICFAFSSWIVGRKVLGYVSLKLAQSMWGKIYVKPTGYGEDCKIHSVSPVRVSMPLYTPLSSLDYFEMRFIRSFVYYYEEKLEIKPLKSALAEMLQIYPQVGGIFVMKDSKVIIDHRNPFVNVIEENFSKESLSEIFGFPATDEEILSFCNSAKWNNQNWSRFLPQLETEFPVAIGKALTEVKINFLHLDSGIHTVLAVGFSHGLNDAGSAFTFINEWALRTKSAQSDSIEILSKTVVPDHDRYKLHRIPRISFTKNEALQVGFKIQPYLKFAAGLILYSFVSGKKPSTLEHFIFSNEVLSDYKEKIISNEPDRFEGKIISRNDILSSLFWKLRADLEDRASIYNWNSLFNSRQLIVIANIRGRISGIEKNYFGNCLLFATSFIGAKELSKMHISDLVLRVRETVDEVDPEHCVRAVGILNELIAQRNTLALLGLDPPVDYPLHTLVTNWSKFEVYGADFGTGKPKRFVYPLGFSIPGIVIVAPTRNNDGLECILSGTKMYFSKLNKLGVNDPKNVSHILKSF